MILLSLLLAFILVLTACGGNSQPASGGDSKPAANGTSSQSASSGQAGGEKSEKKYDQGVTDTTIKLGVWGPMSGPAATYSVVSKGTDAYFKYINETQGGINGRKIEFIIIDDEYQPSKAVAAAKKLVEEEKVFALVGPLGTPSNKAAMPYLQKSGIPVIAPSTGSSLWANPPKKNYFALQTNYQVEGRLFAKYANEELKAKTVGIFYQNDDFGKEGYEAAKEELAKRGMKIVAEAPYNPADVDFSSAALTMKNANPDVIMVFAIPKPAAAFAKELHKIGFKPNILVTYVSGDTIMFDLAGSEAWEGIITTSWVPIIDEKDPKVKPFIENFKKYYPNEKVSTLAAGGWAYGEVAVEALKRAGDHLTWENLIQSLETFDKWNDGLAHNVTYKPDQRQGQNSMFFMKAVNGSYQKISDYVELD